ncbi:MAG TPA: hypothetical protein VEV41_12920, partial [Terriglobales bacterium]|nr:hypothetical protein [Terriglobales bacterium]
MPPHRPIPLLALVLIVLATVTWGQSKPAADLIITNAKIWTVDQQHPTAEAVAVLRERIVAVGTAGDIRLWRGPDTKVIDAGG